MKEFTEETRHRMSESAKRRCSDPAWLVAQHARATPLPIEAVREMYERGMTQAEIALVFGVSQKVICRCMKNNGIKARTPAKRNQYGENNCYWRGGRYQDENGYIHVKADGHPRAKKCGGYVPEHILIAEAILGRFINRSEHVHHINGIKNDNRPENLSVMKASDHIRYHSLLRNGIEQETPLPITKYHFVEDET